MASCFRSKLSTVGRSLLESLGNNSGLFRTSNEMMERMTYKHVLSQQQRTFIQMGTKLKVVDNSGDTIVASVKEAQPRGKVKKGEVVYDVVVRAAMQRGRCDGSEIRFDDNAVILVNKQLSQSELEFLDQYHMS
ncbi:hypothetical protein MKX01_034715 [Papaver californicum]|nr:hypothetical protein MKX01_034715 [Papaver californicum]